MGVTFDCSDTCMHFTMYEFYHIIKRCCSRLRSPQLAIVSLATGWVGQEYRSLLKYADA